MIQIVENQLILKIKKSVGNNDLQVNNFQFVSVQNIIFLNLHRTIYQPICKK